MALSSEILNYQLSEVDQRSIAEIKMLENEYAENEKKQRFLKTEIDFKKSKLNISYQPLVMQCLAVGQDYFALKTPIQVSNCVSLSFEIETSREMKNVIATTLSNLFHDKRVGKIQINGKSYYGLPEYFNSDMVTVKAKYKSYVEGRKNNP